MRKKKGPDIASMSGSLGGAVDETRTRDLHLGKVALYQLSYYRKAKYIIAHFAPEGKP